MANASDASSAPSAPLPPPFIPADQSGLSQAFLQGANQVGFGPQAISQNNPQSDGYGMAPQQFSDADVVANLLQQLNTPSNTPGPVPNRPTDRPGVVPGMGGLLGQDATTYMPGDVLSRLALAAFPQNLQTMFANRKIDRPASIGDVYGTGQNATAGGYYDPSNGAIVLARGNADAYGNPNVDVGGAQHEILHAISNEVSPFREDANQNYVGLKEAVAKDLPSLAANPQTQLVAQRVLANIQHNDWGHVFTELGLAHVNGPQLPPAMSAYFARLSEGVPIPQRPSDPNADSPPNSLSRLVPPSP